MQSIIAEDAIDRSHRRQQETGSAVSAFVIEYLTYLFDIFDDFFLREMLKDWTILRWIDYDPEGGLGSTVMEPQELSLRILASISRYPKRGVRYRHLKFAATIDRPLHKLRHAILRIFPCRIAIRYRACGARVTVQLGQALRSLCSGP